MIAHHLYREYALQCAEQLRHGDIVLHIANRGKVCVLLFLFVTGYGYRIVAGKDECSLYQSVWNRLKHFYPVFLVMLAIETLLLAGFGYSPRWVLSSEAGSWKGYLLCASGLVDVYKDYWYIGVFLCGAMVIYPLLRWGLKRSPLAETIVFVAIAVVCVPASVGEVNAKVFGKATSWFLSVHEMLLVLKSPLFMALSWMGGFLLGWACSAVCTDGRRMSWLLLGLGAAVCVVTKWHSVLLMLFCLFAAKLLARYSIPRSVLGKLGALSAVMWLNHRLIFGYWFADFFYSLPAPCDYLLLVALSALGTRVFMWVYDGVKGMAAHIFASLGGRRRESGATRP